MERARTVILGTVPSDRESPPAVGENPSVKIVATPEELAAALEIRRRVFVEEQKIPARLDADGLDPAAIHVLAFQEKEPIATGRLVKSSESEGVLARIAVLAAHRGRGLGERIVARLEEEAWRCGLRALSLEPHRHLRRFYEGLGYRQVAGDSVVGEHQLITMVKQLDRRAESRRRSSSPS